MAILMNPSEREFKIVLSLHAEVTSNTINLEEIKQSSIGRNQKRKATTGPEERIARRRAIISTQMPPTQHPTPHHTPHQTPHQTPHTTSYPTPHTTPYPTPHTTPYPTPHQTPHPTPHPIPHTTPYPTPHKTPHITGNQILLMEVPSFLQSFEQCEVDSRNRNCKEWFQSVIPKLLQVYNTNFLECLWHWIFLSKSGLQYT